MVASVEEQREPCDRHEPVLWAAHQAANLGLSVFFTGHDKRPVSKWKRYRDKASTEEQLTNQFNFHNKYGCVRGYAVITGAISGGLYIRDFDDPTAYLEWASKYTHYAEIMPTVRTRSGFHVYGRWHKEYFAKYDDGEFRGTPKQYTIGPGSYHSDGVYHWNDYEWPTSDNIHYVDPFSVGLLHHAPRHKSQIGKERNGNPLTNCVRSSSIVPPSKYTELVLKHVPHRTGERNSRLMKLSRCIRQKTDINSLYDAIPLFNEWYKRSVEIMDTKSYEINKRDFVAIWESHDASKIQNNPLEYAKECASLGETPMEKVRIACDIMSEQTENKFILSVRDLADVINLGKSQAHSLLKTAIAQGWLEVVEKGIPSATMRKATVYRLNT